MDKRSLVLYLSGLAAAGAVVALAASCSDQPRIKCTAGHGSFATVFSGGPPCLGAGEEMGVEAYNYPLPDKTNLDPNRGSLAIAPVPLDNIIHEHKSGDTARKAFSIGDWLTPSPTDDNFCTVNAPTDTEQDLPFEPEESYPDGGGRDAVPAHYAKYHWTKVRFYATASLPGNQLVADVEITQTAGLPDGGAGTPCTGTVHVVGLWPLVHCDADPLEDGGAPPSPIDETKCSPEPDNSKGRPTGSGINPDLKTRCHPDLHLCVLPGDPQTL